MLHALIQLTALLHVCNPARATQRGNRKHGEGIAGRSEVPYQQHPPPFGVAEEDGRESSQLGAIELAGSNGEAEAFPDPRWIAEDARGD